jgi:predicted O-methyltransferase YrrM
LAATMILDRIFEKAWRARARRHENLLYGEEGTWRYFEMVRQHALGGVNYFKALPLFTAPLLNRAETLVELGSSFTYYPETYSDKWGVSTDATEGLVSTRLLLAACRLLRMQGIGASLISVDIRESTYYANARQLLSELGLFHLWQPVMLTDTLAWLEERGRQTALGEVKQIDFALVDSNHTHRQVSEELKALVPLMSPRGIIVVDDVFTTAYRHDDRSIPQESASGVRRGGEYGAVLEFMRRHPEWHVDWIPQGMVLLQRRA